MLNLHQEERDWFTTTPTLHPKIRNISKMLMMTINDIKDITEKPHNANVSNIRFHLKTFFKYPLPIDMAETLYCLS